MGRFRDAVMRRKLVGEGSPRYRFGAPATDRQVAEAEAALGCPIPVPLRELYAEFDGAWIDGHDWGNGVLVPLWVVLPCGALEPRRRDFLGSGYAMEPGWAGEFARCVMFNPHENGARLFFLTDRGAWGVQPGVVGVWDHDGGPHNTGEPLEVFLSR